MQHGVSKGGNSRSVTRHTPSHAHQRHNVTQITTAHRRAHTRARLAAASGVNGAEVRIEDRTPPSICLNQQLMRPKDAQSHTHTRPRLLISRPHVLFYFCFFYFLWPGASRVSASPVMSSSPSDWRRPSLLSKFRDS